MPQVGQISAPPRGLTVAKQLARPTLPAPAEQPAKPKSRASLTFVERERVGSIQACEDMAATARAIYAKALEHDGLPPDSCMVVFSLDNPYVPYYDKAMEQYWEMALACAAHGYVGLSTAHKEVYSSKKAKR